MRVDALFAAGVIGCLVAGPGYSANAVKTYPERPIRVIVPNTTGSSTDTLTRIVVNELSNTLGQQVVVDNRGGAAGIIGMEIGKAANADGYTLVSATTAASAIARLLVSEPRFHPVDDFDPVVQFAETLNVLVVNPKLPIKTVGDLLDYARSGKTPFNMASAGIGSQSHLSGAFFQVAAKINSLHVPYKGGGPASASVVAGESQWTLIPAPAAMSHVHAGRMRAIGHTLSRRTPLLRDVPPISETIPGFEYTGWMGFLVPKGTPSAINSKVRAAVSRAVKAESVVKGMALQATEIVVRGPAEFRKVIQESMVQNAKLVKTLKLTSN